MGRSVNLSLVRPHAVSARELQGFALSADARTFCSPGLVSRIVAPNCAKECFLF